MKKKNYIGWGQLLTLLLICRIFTLMTYVPLIAEGYSMSVQIIAAGISSVIQAIALIPAIVLHSRVPGGAVTGIAFSKNRFLGGISALLYFIYFFSYGINGLINFKRFLTGAFFPHANGYVLAAVLLAFCVYCASMGIEGIARSSLIVLAAFVIMLIMMSANSAKDFDPLNYYFDRGFGGSLFSAITEDLVRNGEIVAVIFLSKHIKNNLKSGVLGFVAAKLLILEFVSVLIIGVLGNFAGLTDYPFLSVGSSAGVKYLHRSDAVYLVLWTLTAVTNISLFLYISSSLMGEAFTKLKFRNIICGVIAAAVIIPLIYTDSALFSSVDNVYRAAAIIALVFLPPLLTLFFIKKPPPEGAADPALPPEEIGA